MEKQKYVDQTERERVRERDVLRQWTAHSRRKKPDPSKGHGSRGTGSVCMARPPALWASSTEWGRGGWHFPLPSAPPLSRRSSHGRRPNAKLGTATRTLWQLPVGCSHFMHSKGKIFRPKMEMWHDSCSPLSLPLVLCSQKTFLLSLDLSTNLPSSSTCCVWIMSKLCEYAEQSDLSHMIQCLWA